jgi:uncharacterized protein YeaO (DUF488 family)
MGTIKVKRIYEPAEKKDGLRILVDRLWPRGMKKEDAHIDEWLKAIAPSDQLRKRFHSDTSKWEEFEAKYKLELQQNEAVKQLLDIAAKHPVVTLLYSVRDEHRNHALVLRQFLEGAGGLGH